MAADPTAPFRRGFLGLAALSVAGTAVELAMLRHWNGLVQLIPWGALGLLAAGLVALVAGPGRGTVRVVRAVAAVVLLTAALGMFEHVLANYRAAPLDFRYTVRWPIMSAPARWWAAFSGAVGPSPALAPAVLAWAALCTWFATLRHPAVATSVPTTEDPLEVSVRRADASEGEAAIAPG